MKINFLYVVDCIVKNVGSIYLELFSKRLKEIFLFALLSITDRQEKLKYFQMRKLWDGYFADDILKDIDLGLFIIDENWLNELSASPTIKANDSRINDYDSLKSLPIISSKLKSEAYVLFKASSTYNDSITSPFSDCNKENEEFQIKHPLASIQPIWRIEIPEYPLFPDIGTDPRLLRRWYSNEKSQDISIDNKVYRLLLNRIQPCVLIDNLLHAVRFYSTRFQLKVDEIVFDIGPVGASTIEIADRSYCACIGGPRHELVLAGMPYCVPMDGGRYAVSLDNKVVSCQWLLDCAVQLCILPAIPTHIGQWGWKGMFGSPKYLMQRPLNPMKPLPNKPYVKPKSGNRVAQETQPVDEGEGEDDGGFDWPRVSTSMAQAARKGRGVSWDSGDSGMAMGGKERSVVAELQRANGAMIGRLFQARPCPMCHRMFEYGTEISLSDHLLQHHANGKCYQLLNDWIVAAVASSGITQEVWSDTGASWYMVVSQVDAGRWGL